MGRQYIIPNTGKSRISKTNTLLRNEGKMLNAAAKLLLKYLAYKRHSMNVY